MMLNSVLVSRFIWTLHSQSSVSILVEDGSFP